MLPGRFYLNKKGSLGVDCFRDKCSAGKWLKVKQTTPYPWTKATQQSSSSHLVMASLKLPYGIVLQDDILRLP